LREWIATQFGYELDALDNLLARGMTKLDPAFCARLEQAQFIVQTNIGHFSLVFSYTLRGHIGFVCISLCSAERGTKTPTAEFRFGKNWDKCFDENLYLSFKLAHLTQ
jgi:hypothetical protein